MKGKGAREGGKRGGEKGRRGRGRGGEDEREGEDGEARREDRPLMHYNETRRSACAAVAAIPVQYFITSNYRHRKCCHPQRLRLLPDHTLLLPQSHCGRIEF